MKDQLKKMSRVKLKKKKMIMVGTRMDQKAKPSNLKKGCYL
jgi:hypothetical protein